MPAELKGCSYGTRAWSLACRRAKVQDAAFLRDIKCRGHLCFLCSVCMGFMCLRSMIHRQQHIKDIVVQRKTQTLKSKMTTETTRSEICEKMCNGCAITNNVLMFLKANSRPTF